MNTTTITKWIAVTTCAFALPLSLIADDVEDPIMSKEPPLAGETGADDECSKEILMAFFPEPFVNDTLGRYKVPKEQWEVINAELAPQDKEVIKIVQDKAAKMDPNPLKDVQQRQAAVQLFKETLFDIFSGVMKKHGVTDDKQLHEMLDDIQHQKAKRFTMCVDRQKQQEQQQD